MNFNLMNLFNFISNSSSFQQFKNQILQSGKDPRKLLEEEIKRRGITPEQLNELLQIAKQINKNGLK